MWCCTQPSSSKGKGHRRGDDDDDKEEGGGGSGGGKMVEITDEFGRTRVVAKKSQAYKDHKVRKEGRTDGCIHYLALNRKIIHRFTPTSRFLIYTGGP